MILNSMFRVPWGRSHGQKLVFYIIIPDYEQQLKYIKFNKIKER